MAFLSIESLWFSFNSASRGGKAPARRTKSRQRGESPAMLPNAHTLIVSCHLQWGGKRYLRLLADIENVRRKKAHKVGDSAGVDDDLGVVRGTGSNVCQVSN